MDDRILYRSTETGRQSDLGVLLVIMILNQCFWQYTVRKTGRIFI